MRTFREALCSYTQGPSLSVHLCISYKMLAHIQNGASPPHSITPASPSYFGSCSCS